MYLSPPSDSDGPVTITAPLDFSRVTTGWPSPAAPVAESLNLQRWLIQHPSATFLMRVAGDAMTPLVNALRTEQVWPANVKHRPA